jgi:hypothetical protein
VSNMQRRKGSRVENEIVHAHKNVGIHAERVPLSGGSHYRGEGHDIDIYAFGREAAPATAEVKSRSEGRGFALLERWLGEYDVLFLKRDRQDPLVVVPWSVWVRLINRKAGDLTWRPEVRNGRPDETSAKPVRGSAKGGSTNGGQEAV